MTHCSVLSDDIKQLEVLLNRSDITQTQLIAYSSNLHSSTLYKKIFPNVDSLSSTLKQTNMLAAHSVPSSTMKLGLMHDIISLFSSQITARSLR